MADWNFVCPKCGKENYLKTPRYDMIINRLNNERAYMRAILKTDIENVTNVCLECGYIEEDDVVIKENCDE